MSLTPEIRPVEPGDAWDTVVRDDGGLVFASSAYLRLIQGQLEGSRPAHLGAYADGTLIGVMPALTRCTSSGCVSNSSPFYGSHGGVYCALDEGRQACVGALLGAFRAACADQGCVVSNVVEPLGSSEGELYHAALDPWRTDRRVGQLVTELPHEGEELLGRYHQKTRNMVRKAAKEGVEVRATTDPASLVFVAEIHGEGMRAVGGKPKQPAFFTALGEQLTPGEQWEVYEGWLGRERVAALLVLHFGDCTEYFTPVTRAEYRSSQPMSMLVHEAMLGAARRGSHRFNFGGTWESQEGVYRFKSRFGATDVPYHYFVTKYVPGDPFDGADGAKLASAYEGYYLFPFERA